MEHTRKRRVRFLMKSYNIPITAQTEKTVTELHNCLIIQPDTGQKRLAGSIPAPAVPAHLASNQNPVYGAPRTRR